MERWVSKLSPALRAALLMGVSVLTFNRLENGPRSQQPPGNVGSRMAGAPKGWTLRVRGNQK